LWFSPFDLLPNELTAHILSFTVEGKWQAIVGFVCRHWRQLVIQMNNGGVPKSLHLPQSLLFRFWHGLHRIDL